MELIESTNGNNIDQNYQVKLWWDEEESVYVVRYTWQNLRKKYTRTKRIANAKSAQWYYSYSIHTCRRHIGLEESPLSNLYPTSFNQNRKEVLVIWK